MNEVADKMVMVALHKHLGHPMSQVTSPQDISFPPGGFRFFFVVEGKAIDGDTPLTVRRRGLSTLRDRAMKKECQGHLLRIADKTNITPKILGKRGTLSRILRHLATSHSQTFYRDNRYRELHLKFGNVRQVEGVEAQREEALLCPLCTPDQNQYRCKGNVRHMHIYCQNDRLQVARHTLYGCLEQQLHLLVEAADKASLIIGGRFNISQQLNDSIRLLEDDDCGVLPPPRLLPSLPPHTISIDEWGHTSAMEDSRRADCSRRWPLACRLGFITSRKEFEWNTEITSSTDSIYGGVLPNVMTRVISSFLIECKGRDEYKDQPVFKKTCDSLNKIWHDIEVMTRENARQLQKVVVAQLQQYSISLKAMEKREIRATTSRVAVPHTKNPSGQSSDALALNKDCNGLRCKLNIYKSQFRSRESKLGPKTTKCSECYSFECAVKLARTAEQYLITQLEKDTDDIINLTAGLVGLMERSTCSPVAREDLYDTILKIPHLNAALGAPTKAKRSKKDNYPRFSKTVIRAATLLATTLGIVPSKPQGNPIPTLCREEAIALRQTEGKDLDSWEYLQWRILNHNTDARILKILNEAKNCMSREEILLKRLEKGRSIHDRPASLATALPYRMSGCTDNRNTLQSKKETLIIACEATSLSATDITECRRQKAIMRRDEGTTTPATKKRKSSKDNTCDKQEGSSGSNAIDISDSEDITHTSCQDSRQFRGLMNLVALTPADIATLQEGKLVNDACIDALADALQTSTGANDISICHTGFWAAIRDYGWGQEAKKLIHPDPEETTMAGWQAHRFTRGHLKSKLLLIPCNFPGTSKVEAGHWILALRERCENGKHKLYVIDSLGQDSGTRHRNDIVNALVNTPIFKSFPRGKAHAVPEQSEYECGARVAKYMMEITQKYLNTKHKMNITQILGATLGVEKANGLHEAHKCRQAIKEKLQGERRNRGIGI
jgi:hypothetical protein